MICMFAACHGSAPLTMTGGCGWFGSAHHDRGVDGSAPLTMTGLRRKKARPGLAGTSEI